ncbi:MAG: hypothetical protein IK099_11455 [Clostridia bacterium]|nr:hypothetical protein [Clostridia bacterium]
MKKDKHPVYWALMALLILLLALGVALFVYGITLGKGHILLPIGTSV